MAASTTTTNSLPTEATFFMCGVGRPRIHDWTVELADQEIGLYQDTDSSSVLCIGPWDFDVPVSSPMIVGSFFLMFLFGFVLLLLQRSSFKPR